MLIYEVLTPQGNRWIRYAHLNEILVKNGDVLEENTPIAKMGSTGNSTACHLHWDIFKKIPPDWRWFPKNIEQLNEYMIDPLEFVDVYKDYKKPSSDKTRTEAEWQTERDERNKNWSLYQAELVSSVEILKELQIVKQELKDEREDRNLDLEKIGNILAVPAELSKIIPAIETCVTFEEKSKKLEKKLDEERAEYDKKLKDLQDKFNTLKNQFDIAKKELDDLKEEKPEPVIIEAQEEIQPFIARLLKWLKG